MKMKIAILVACASMFALTATLARELDKTPPPRPAGTDAIPSVIGAKPLAKGEKLPSKLPVHGTTNEKAKAKALGNANGKDTKARALEKKDAESLSLSR
jgi:hypothetical protein